MLLFELHMTYDEIMPIAIQARRDFDNKSVDVQYLKSLVEKHLPYIAENYKDGLTQWIEQSVANFPIDCCEIGAAVLLDRVGEGEIAHGRYEREPIGPHNIRKSHTFWTQAETPGKTALMADITADQYGGPPIFVGSLKRPWTLPDWTKIT